MTARISCVCDPSKSHLPSGTALICPGDGGHACCTRCAPYGTCPLHPTLKLTPIKLLTDSKPRHYEHHAGTLLFRGHQCTVSAIECDVRCNPSLIAPRGAHGPIINAVSCARCDRLVLLKTSPFPECAIVTITQNIPNGPGSVFELNLIGTIWPGDEFVELWPKLRLASSLYLSNQPFKILGARMTPLFPDDIDGDIFGIPRCTLRAALQNPCVWSRMPWLNKGRVSSDPEIKLPIEKIPRQQPRCGSTHIVVNGSVVYSKLKDDTMDYLCPLCGKLQTKHDFFSMGCGVGALCVPS